MSCTTDMLENTLACLSKPPRLMITDSQAFRTVYDKKPKESLLTSFSVLFAHYKGDIRYFIDSAERLSSLSQDSRILIAEACTHRPLEEDIGRVKLPRLLRKKLGEALEIDFYTLKSTEVNSVDSAVHALFDIEDRYGLVPDKIGDNICLVLDQADSSAYPDRTDTEISEFNTALLSWYKARISLLDGKVDEDTYMTWKEKYPGYSAIDENGTPYIPSVRKKEEAARDEDMEFKYKMYVSAKEWAGETDILSYEEFAARSN